MGPDTRSVLVLSAGILPFVGQLHACRRNKAIADGLGAVVLHPYSLGLAVGYFRRTVGITQDFFEIRFDGLKEFR